MKRHVDPFPAVADLFSGLVIATFGGLMLFAGLLPGPGPGPGPGDKVDRRAHELQDQVTKALVKSLNGKASECGGDVCVDADVTFDKEGDDAVSSADSMRLNEACRAIRQAVGDHPKELEISIEGHSDSKQLQHSESERAKYVYNWNLSASRASSVLYEFKSCGIMPPEFRIVALGYADTQPLGTDKQNRRTTFRIRIDRDDIARELVQKRP
jgi:outer membrane protein OmpA-like peptidoglycan-associated protein